MPLKKKVDSRYKILKSTTAQPRFISGRFSDILTTR